MSQGRRCMKGTRPRPYRMLRYGGVCGFCVFCPLCRVHWQSDHGFDFTFYFYVNGQCEPIAKKLTFFWGVFLSALSSLSLSTRLHGPRTDMAHRTHRTHTHTHARGRGWISMCGSAPLSPHACALSGLRICRLCGKKSALAPKTRSNPSATVWSIPHRRVLWCISQ